MNESVSRRVHTTVLFATAASPLLGFQSSVLTPVSGPDYSLFPGMQSHDPGIFHQPLALCRGFSILCVRRAVDIVEKVLVYPVKGADDFDVRSRLADARELLCEAKGL
jgi:hypothetical protein